MSNQSPSEIKAVGVRIARVRLVTGSAAAGLLITLIAHAVLVHQLHLPIAYFNLHVGGGIFFGLVAFLSWCTELVLRALGAVETKLDGDMRQLKKRTVTTDQVKQLVKDAFDEGQITGLATGLADLERRDMRPQEN